MTAGSAARPRSNTITVRCLLFASLREAAGADSIELTLPHGSPVTALRSVLSERFPSLSGLLSVARFAVDGEYVADEFNLRDGLEVAVIPPVSGGQPEDEDVYAEVVRDPIDPVVYERWVQRHEAGAVVTFLGTVRAVTGDRRTVYLEYDAYGDMAVRKLREIAQNARERFGLERVAVVHRFGRMEPGEVSVVIAVSAAHRAQAFDGCRYVIEAIKKDVPIWKKEVWSDGTEEWIHPQAQPG